VPKAAWLNLYGLTPTEAAERVSERFVQPGFLEAWHLAQIRLAALFGDGAILLHERQRLRHAVVQALRAVIEGD